MHNVSIVKLNTSVDPSKTWTGVVILEACSIDGMKCHPLLRQRGISCRLHDLRADDTFLRVFADHRSTTEISVGRDSVQRLTILILSDTCNTVLNLFILSSADHLPAQSWDSNYLDFSNNESKRTLLSAYEPSRTPG